VYRILITTIIVFLCIQVSLRAYAQENLTKVVDPAKEDGPTYDDEVLLGDYLMMPETLLQRIKGHRDDFILIDLRSPSLYAKGHVRGARQCEWDGGEFIKKSAEFPRDRDIIVISGNGGDGMLALKFLLKNGFTRVYSIEGGMENWLYKEYLEY
jgi:rhodanese-related sulfurtransferase